MSILIPNKPLSSKIASDDGKIHPEWAQFFDGLLSTLQSNLSPEGVSIPKQTTDNITTLGTVNNAGTLLYDIETHELKININGTYKVIQTI